MLASVCSFAHQAPFQVNSPSNLRKAEQLLVDLLIIASFLVVVVLPVLTAAAGLALSLGHYLS